MLNSFKINHLNNKHKLDLSKFLQNNLKKVTIQLLLKAQQDQNLK